MLALHYSIYRNITQNNAEVTKVALKRILGEVTVAHTTDDINEFSVTSFFEVGLELGLIDEKSDMVYYS